MSSSKGETMLPLGVQALDSGQLMPRGSAKLGDQLAGSASTIVSV